MNRSFIFNFLRTSCYLINIFLTNQRLKAFSNYKVETNQISPKLIYQLNELKNKFEIDEILYGTIETWLIWNLSYEKIFATEVSCACCTGFYDIFKVF
jgi:putative glycerol kinase 5